MLLFRITVIGLSTLITVEVGLKKVSNKLTVSITSLYVQNIAVIENLSRH